MCEHFQKNVHTFPLQNPIMKKHPPSSQNYSNCNFIALAKKFKKENENLNLALAACLSLQRSAWRADPVPQVT